MNLVKLRLSMVWTLALIIGLSTLFFTVILSLMDALSLFTLVGFVVTFNVLQWLFSPYLIGMLYRVQEVSPAERPDLYRMVERIAQKGQILMPRVMISNIPIPNAFAYGSPVAGTRLAVTSGLLRALEPEEVEAVVGHELGHIKHRDVQIMMFASVLPAIVYYISYSLYISSYYRNSRERGSSLPAIGAIGMVLYFGLYLLSLGLSRLREYYADRFSATVVDDGARKLSEGLAKIVTYTSRVGMYSGVKAFSNFKALFISDPDTASRDAAEIRSDSELVQKILSREPSALDTFAEIFSTHPNIVKRLRALQEIE